MPVNFINHQNKQVLYVDYSNLRKEAMIDLLYDTAKFYDDVPPNSFLVLINMTDAYGSHEFMKEAKKVRETVYDGKVKKSAIIGIHGIKSILLKAYNAMGSQNVPVKPFESKEAALDYLCRD